jgi:hypothetical protein
MVWQTKLNYGQAIGLLLLLFANQAFADGYKHAVGLGLQYGMLGYQISYLSDDTKYYGAIGAGSVAIGAQKFIDKDKKHSFGINLGRIFILSDIAGLTYNYAPRGMHREGVVLGVELGRAREHGDSITENFLSIFGLEGDRVQENYVSLNIAYQF